jgi:hypothetical protein
MIKTMMSRKKILIPTISIIVIKTNKSLKIQKRKMI